MVFGPSGRGHDFQNQYDLSLETPEHLKQPSKIHLMFANPLLELSNFAKNGTDGTRQIPKIRLILFENFEYGINIFQKNDMAFW